MTATVFLTLTLIASFVIRNEGCVPTIDVDGVLKGFTGDCTSTLYVDLESQGISYMKPDSLDLLTDVQTLLLGRNSISVLPPSVFDSLTSLTYLGLDVNPIELVGPNVFDPIINAKLYMPDALDSNLNCCSISGLTTIANKVPLHQCFHEGNKFSLPKYDDQEKPLEFNIEPLVACTAAESEVKELDLVSCISECGEDRNCAGFAWYEEKGECVLLQSIDVRWSDRLATCYIKKVINPSEFVVSMSNLEASLRGFLLSGNQISSSASFHEAYETCVVDDTCGGINFDGVDYQPYTGSVFVKSTQDNHRAWKIKTSFENLAFGKIARVYNTFLGYPASKATDGIVSSSTYACYHSHKLLTPHFFELDLGSDYQITSSVLHWRQINGNIYNHYSYSDVLVDFINSNGDVIFSFSPDFSTPAFSYSVSFNDPIIARFVNVTVPTGKQLAINELEVFGQEIPISPVSGVQIEDSWFLAFKPSREKFTFFDVYWECEMVSDCIAISYHNGKYFLQKAFGYNHLDPPQPVRLFGSAFIRRQGVISSKHPLLADGFIDCQTSVDHIITNDCGVAEFKFYASEAGNYKFRILARTINGDRQDSFYSYVGTTLVNYNNPIETTVPSSTNDTWTLSSIGTFSVNQGVNTFFMVEREVGAQLLAVGSQSTKLLVFGSEAINLRKVDWTYTSLLTGCTNYQADESDASLSNEADLGLAKMYNYCISNTAGSATPEELSFCCGQNVNCTSVCTQQSDLVKLPRTDPVMSTFTFDETTAVEDINTFISNTLGNSDCIDCNIDQGGVELVSVEYGRKLEDSSLIRGKAPYTISYNYNYSVGSLCHPIDITVTLSNRHELSAKPVDHCIGIRKIYYVTFKGIEIISPRSLVGPRSQSFSGSITNAEEHTSGWLDAPGVNAWVAPTAEDHYFQINLGGLKTVRGVVTQGRDILPEWVTKFKVSYSSDTVVFYDIDEGFIFTGNYDYNTKIYHAFLRPLKARVIRIHVVEFNDNASMRAGVVVLTERKTSIRFAGGERGYINVPYDLEAIQGFDSVVVLDFDDRPRWEFVHISLNKYHLVYDNQLLGVTGDGDTITLFNEDDGSGRQQWYVIPVRGSSSRYNLKIAGGTGPDGRLSEEKRFLSVSGDMGTFRLRGEDFENGNEQWTIDSRALVTADVSDLVNVARGKTVTASSIESELTVPTLIVDGNTHTAFVSGDSGSRWVEVDLGSLYIIKKIRIFNSASFANFEFLENRIVSFLDRDRVVLQNFAWNYIDYLFEKIIEGGILARYVHIHLDIGSINIGELEIYALESSFEEVSEGVNGACFIDAVSNTGIPSDAYEKDYVFQSGTYTEVSCADICSREKRCLAYEYSAGQCKIWFTKPNVVQPLTGHFCKYKQFEDKMKIVSPQERLTLSNPAQVPLHSYSDAVNTQGWLDSPTSWSSDSATPYYQIDSGSVGTIVGVVTQGNNAFENNNKYVTSYGVQYSIDGDLFFNVPGKEIYPGNTDNVDTRVTNRFRPVIARYIRVFPLSFENQIAMRVGIIVEKSGLNFGDNIALSKTSSLSSGKDIAFGKTVTAASEYEYFDQHSVRKLVDGDHSTYYASSQDTRGANWIEVDLEGSYDINAFEIINRYNNFYERIVDFELSILASDRSIIETVPYSEWNSVRISYQKRFDVPVNGRFIRIELNSGLDLQLSELKVFGSASNGNDGILASISDDLATTALVQSPFWTVDLGQNKNLAGIKLYNRTPERQNFDVFNNMVAVDSNTAFINDGNESHEGTIGECESICLSHYDCVGFDAKDCSVDPSCTSGTGSICFFKSWYSGTKSYTGGSFHQKRSDKNRGFARKQGISLCNTTYFTGMVICSTDYKDQCYKYDADVVLRFQNGIPCHVNGPDMFDLQCFYDFGTDNWRSYIYVEPGECVQTHSTAAPLDYIVSFSQSFSDNSVPVETLTDSSRDECKARCDELSNCFGFVWDNTAAVGYLKSHVREVIPALSEFETYIKNDFTRTFVPAFEFEVTAPYIIENDYAYQPLEIGEDADSVQRLLDGTSGYAQYPMWCESEGVVTLSITLKRYGVDQDSLFVWVATSVSDFKVPTSHIYYSHDSSTTSAGVTFPVVPGINFLFIAARKKGTYFKSALITSGCFFSSGYMLGSPKKASTENMKDFSIEFRDSNQVLNKVVDYGDWGAIQESYEISFDTAVSAQHVTLSLPSEEILSFAELEIYEIYTTDTTLETSTSDFLNLAHGKPVTAASVDDLYQTINLVDDDLTTSYISDVSTDGANWIEVNLQNLFIIQSFELYAGGDDMIGDFTLKILDDDKVIVRTFTQSHWGSRHVYDEVISGSVFGKYLRVELTSGNRLHLADLKVFGSHAPFAVASCSCDVWEGSFLGTRQCQISCAIGEKSLDGYTCQECTEQIECSESFNTCTEGVTDLYFQCTNCTQGFNNILSNSCQACTVPVDCTSTSVNCFSESNELECDTCSVGYLLDNNVCTACTQPDNCATFAENCFPGSSKLECSVCSEGYSLNNNVCSGKLGCTQQPHCADQGHGVTCLPNGLLECDLCSPEYYVTDGFCNACTQPSNCNITTGNCLAGSSELKCDSCFKGYFLNGNVCTECAQQSNCVYQNAGAPCLANDELECDLCSSTYFLKDGFCTSCTRPSNCSTTGDCLSGSTELECSTCFQGHSLQGNVCTECIPQEKCLIDQSITSDCVDGTEFLKCSACEKGFDFTVEGYCKECTPLPLCSESESSCLPDSLFLTCTKCAGGVDLLPNGRCEECSPQSNCKFSEADQCVRGSNELTCIECDAGFSLDESGICKGCLPQDGCSNSLDTCIENSIVQPCGNCEPNYYLELDVCNNCTEQRFCAYLQSDHSRCVDSGTELACNECLVGFYTDTAKICQSCNTQDIAVAANCATVTSCSGTDGKMDILCNECMEGSYMDGNQCKECQAIPFCNVTGSSCLEGSSYLECLECVEPYYMNNNFECEICNSIPEDCAIIGSGCMNNTDTRSCKLCNTGYFASDIGRCFEQNCVAKDETRCEVSLENTCILNSNFTKCLECKDNFYLEADSGLCLDSCTDAPKNCDTIIKACYDGTTVRQCAVCTEGYFVTDSGSCQPQDPEKCNASTKEELHCDQLNVVDGQIQCAYNSNTGGCLRCSKGYYLSPEGTCEIRCDILQDSCIKFAANSGCLDETTTRACDECANGKYSSNGKCLKQECAQKYQVGCQTNDVSESCVFNQNVMKCQTPKPKFWLDPRLGTTSLCSIQNVCAIGGTKCITEDQLECLECSAGFDNSEGLCVANSVSNGTGALASGAIAGIVAGCIAVAFLALIAALLYKRKARKDLEKIEKRGLGGLTPEQFVLNEINMEKMNENSAENLMQTDAEYQIAHPDSDCNFETFYARPEQGKLNESNIDYCATGYDNYTKPEEVANDYCAATEYSQPDYTQPDEPGTDDYCMATEYQQYNDDYAEPNGDEFYAGIKDSNSNDDYIETNGSIDDDDFTQPNDAELTASSVDNLIVPNECYWNKPAESKLKDVGTDLFRSDGHTRQSTEELALLEHDAVKSELENARRMMAEMREKNELLKASLEKIEA